MQEVATEMTKTYIDFYQKEIDQYIVTFTILDIYMVAERIQGARISKRWWE